MIARDWAEALAITAVIALLAFNLVMWSAPTIGQ
jgi:hypothetical protein